MMNSKACRLSVLILAAVGLRALGGARLFMTLPGKHAAVPASGDHIIAVQPGETFTLEMWLADTAPEAAAYFQIEVAGVATAVFGTGAVSYVDTPGWGGSITVDTGRPEWLFSGFPDFVAYGELDLPSHFTWIAGAPVGEGVVVDGLRYVGEFQFTASPDSGGVYLLDIAPTATFLNDVSGTPIETALQRLLIVIPVPCEVGSPGDCAAFDSACTTGVCDEDTGDCTVEPVTAGGACDDGVFCNGIETCVFPWAACQPGVSPCELWETCNESIDQCTVDCNGNMVDDTCDIDCGAVGGACDVAGCGISEDSNGNDIPDECEIDCNGNGIADVCDIDCGPVGGPCDVAGCGMSEDCDDSGVPDDCELNAWEQTTKLLADDGGPVGRFGFALAVDGDVAVIGAENHDHNHDERDSGSAYVFRKSGESWVQEAELMASDGAPGDRFGHSVAIFGNVAVIGAPDDTDAELWAGSAYIFRRNEDGWAQEAKLLPGDGAASDDFGSSVAVSGDVVVVGDHYHQDQGSFSGAAYVFRRVGGAWAQEAKLLPSDSNSWGWFGRSASISDGVALIGAPGRGGAYIFRKIGPSWVQQQKLVPDDGAGTFIPVAIAGDVAVIGTPHGSAAYVFRRVGQGWFREAKLVAKDSGTFVAFGTSVSISNGVVVIGAPLDNLNGNHSGSAYVFRKIGASWVQDVKLLPADGEAWNEFGTSVGVSGDFALTGAHRADNANGIAAGSAYAFRIGPHRDCNGNGVLDECDIADGVSADANDNLMPDECEPCLFDADCDDGVFCNGGETCVFPEGCMASVPPCELGETCYEGIDECMVDCNGNMVEDACDIDCGPVGGVCDVIGCGTSTDSDGNGIPDECGPCSSDAHCDDGLFCNGSETCVPPEGCWPGVSPCEPGETCHESIDQCMVDCNGNLVADACDLDCGLMGSVCDVDGCGNSQDSDGNGAPDECDDCNGNGIGNMCDIDCAAGGGVCEVSGCGMSEDFNGNGLPDECETCVSDLDCDDGVFCNGPEMCFQFELCMPGMAPCVQGEQCDEALGFCWSDCNGNGVPDQCDIDCGSVGGVCDIAGCGMSEDCDNSGVPDDCDKLGARQLPKLLPDDGASGNLFGTVAVADGVALIGAPYDDDNGIWSGSAYVFRQNGAQWVQEAKLLPDDGSDFDRFGTSVSVSGNLALIGAPAVWVQGAPHAGAAYVFRDTGAGWVQEARFAASNPAPHATLGESVCLSGDIALIGAPRDNDNGEDLGSAYVFRRTGTVWVQETVLTASDGDSSDRFGTAVSVSGDVAVIGASLHDDFGDRSGSAYVFRYDGITWTQEAKLLPDDGAASDYFGRYASVSGDVAVIGAPGDDDNGVDSGSAYVFRHDGVSWAQEAKLLPADGAADAAFDSVSVSGDVIVVGTYVFHWGGASWAPGVRLVADDGVEGDSFGMYVSVAGDLAAIGARTDDDNGNGSGSAYLFRIGDVFDCNDNGVLDACDIDTGTSVDTNDNGIPDDCEPCLGNAACDDGLFCNGAETCVVEEGCLLSVSPCDPDETCYESIDQCMVDCNDNIVPDACDIDCGPVGGNCDVVDCGISDDCDSNGIPDDCEAGDQCDSIRYVNADVPPGGSGATWESAFRDVQDALDYANATPIVTQIWVAAGVYETYDGFELIDGVAMYGGFAGWEKSPVDRDWLANETVLSGAGSAFHVVRVENAGVPAILDGFTVSDGLSWDWFGPVSGGGIQLTNSSADIRNCLIKDNKASTGSGIAIIGGGSASVTLINCRIEGNIGRIPCNKNCGSSPGGGVYSSGASLTMVNTHVAGNKAGGGWYWDSDSCGSGGSGGGIYFSGSSTGVLTLVNCTFQDNAPGPGGGCGAPAAVGGGVFITNTPKPASIVNCYFQNNASGSVVGLAEITYSCGSEQPGLGNLDDCLDLAWVDSGDNESVPPEITTDAWRQPRFVDTPYVPDSGNGVAPIVDMGAGEHTCMLGDPTGEDCDDNDMPDDCEMFAGTADDCNDNLVPDECDITARFSADCDGGGIPDECETLADCNENSLPDACELIDYEWAKLNASGVESADFLGSSASIGGDVAVLGAVGDDDNGDGAGAAYVFHFVNNNAWAEEAKLTASDGREGDGFGCGVAVSGDVVIVGALGDDDNGDGSGSAYVFRSSDGDWLEEAKLTASDGAAGDGFGYPIAVSGNVAVVAAGNEGSGTGAVYVFRFDGDSWVEETKLVGMSSAFGRSLAVDGDIAVVGESWLAFVYRFDGSTWIEEATLERVGAPLGKSVAISDGVVVFGNTLDDDDGLDSGEAHLFRFDGSMWRHEAELHASDASANDRFGQSVSISGNTVVVGAFSFGVHETEAMYVYRFHPNLSAWFEVDKLTASDVENIGLGRMVSVSGEVALAAVGGSGYVYALGADDCNGNSVPDDCDAIGDNDFDVDGDVDLDDFTRFTECSSAPSVPPTAPGSACMSSCLSAFDADGDGDVDVLDYARFQLAFTGAGE